MVLVIMSSSRGTNSFLRAPLKPILICDGNKKHKSIISNMSKGMRIHTLRGTKAIHIEKTLKPIVPKKSVLLIGSRGTQSIFIHV